MASDTSLINENDLISKSYAESVSGGDSLASQLRAAQLRSGRNPMSMVMEHWKLRRKIGRLTLQEYLLYNLYDDSLYDQAEKERFLSEGVHWPITNRCSDLSWRATTEDKWLSYQILHQFGIAVPKTLAIIDSSGRSFGPDRRLENADQLSGFLRDLNTFPIFAKPNNSLGSFGAFVIQAFDNGVVHLDGGRRSTPQDLLDGMVAGNCYLLQEMIENHADIRKYAGAVATLRTMNLVENGKVTTPFTLFKIPVGNNIADNFWRKGNLLANVDRENGKILRVLRGKGPAVEEFNAHPATGQPLVGTYLPYWQELRQLNEDCARLFAPVRYQSLDIAFTDAGPVVVEINSGGSFLLPQLASGRGFLTDEVHAFFAACGWQSAKA
ncbi:hypothetical protein HBA54_01850 [Pelagibius litoralis]|uniref:Alpha-L-glutamate ligase-related protein ATP-grasp domain-containing protein n=1 Tax=Pelagibius litoralis TaxID=374515 RepID=A0A967C2T0_9PROT|nr:sugar-transfer associated ATP-grasp domain-containing protein [Pelagibius litoralis]NIA67329.1 hypothetical protein [Pelagibius litoralis]